MVRLAHRWRPVSLGICRVSGKSSTGEWRVGVGGNSNAAGQYAEVPQIAGSNPIARGSLFRLHRNITNVTRVKCATDRRQLFVRAVRIDRAGHGDCYQGGVYQYF